MWVTWLPKSDAATRRFRGPFHPPMGYKRTAKGPDLDLKVQKADQEFSSVRAGTDISVVVRARLGTRQNPLPRKGC
jgi:hypothetical protein